MVPAVGGTGHGGWRLYRVAIMRRRGTLMTTGLHDFFSRPSPTVARDLIGAQFLVDGVGGMIVETEAYDQAEPASHTYGGPTPRNRAMFGPPASVYIYRSYGLHWCINFVCLTASAVLIRALEPGAGIDVMQSRRGLLDAKRLCSGPGRLSQALAIDKTLDGLSLEAPPFRLIAGNGPIAISIGMRIGITRAVELPWRFGLHGSPYLSKRFHSQQSRSRALFQVERYRHDKATRRLPLRRRRHRRRAPHHIQRSAIEVGVARRSGYPGRLDPPTGVDGEGDLNVALLALRLRGSRIALVSSQP